MDGKCHVMAEIAEEIGLTSIPDAVDYFHAVVARLGSTEHAWWETAFDALAVSGQLLEKMLELDPSKHQELDGKRLENRNLTSRMRHKWTHAGSELEKRYLGDPFNSLRIAQRIGQAVIEVLPSTKPSCAKTTEQWHALEALNRRTYDAIHSASILNQHGLAADACVAIRCAAEAIAKFRYVREDANRVVELKKTSDQFLLDTKKHLKQLIEDLGYPVPTLLFNEIEQLSMDSESQGAQEVLKEAGSSKHIPRAKDNWRNHYVDNMASYVFGDKNRHMALKPLFESGDAFAHSRHSTWNNWVRVENGKLTACGKANSYELASDFRCSLLVVARYFTEHLCLLRPEMEWNYDELFSVAIIICS